MTVAALVKKIKDVFGLKAVQVVGNLDSPAARIAIACGSGGVYLEDAIRVQCDVLVTGEANFHTCLEAKARNISLVLIGHYASERLGVEHLANRLRSEFTELNVWVSKQESDPLQWR
jgi:putative NIF3 family GTP cyclohydrolase 1 type 2